MSIRSFPMAIDPFVITSTIVIGDKIILVFVENWAKNLINSIRGASSSSSRIYRFCRAVNFCPVGFIVLFCTKVMNKRRWLQGLIEKGDVIFRYEILVYE